MKKSERLYNLVMVVLSVGIVFVLIYKFLLKGPGTGERPKIENPHEITVMKLDGTVIRFSELIGETHECYCLFFELTNCQSCIYKGIFELENLEKKGKNCFAIAIHDWLEEIKGWSQHYELKNFSVIKKVDFYEHIHAPYLPIIVKFHNGRLSSYKYVHI